MFLRNFWLLSFGMMSVFSAFSQGRETDILSVISAGAGKPASVETPSAAVSSLEALDFVGDNTVNVGGVLDYIGGGDDVITALSSILGDARAGSQTELSDFSALRFISGAYSANGFYQTGVWTGQNGAGFAGSPLLVPAAGAVPYGGMAFGRVTSGFGYREKFKRMHKGIDIAMSVGDTVRCAMDGVVDKVGYEARGYGHYVTVVHDGGMETRYAHLSLPLVSKGERVTADQAIALSGNSGNSTGPHLHFETRYLGSAIDPTSVFDFSGTYANAYRRVARDKVARYDASGKGVKGSPLSAKSTYIVRQGDTVRKIASRAGISTLRLCQLNFITEDQPLEPGTMLKLK